MLWPVANTTVDSEREIEREMSMCTHARAHTLDCTIENQSATMNVSVDQN